ncbi:hypothetical protein L5515_007146 [Caenorhabditis briggsae]|uniref:Glycosyltransferase family 92 protein n=1 Tax=Caenorhabditis briggsae TaxID=6238 RepID=A0AAE9JLT7_CAEBR|nr:hypothetical protein L5515_007146 [Caenorhabditis briggsae]
MLCHKNRRIIPIFTTHPNIDVYLRRSGFKSQAVREALFIPSQCAMPLKPSHYSFVYFYFVLVYYVGTGWQSLLFTSLEPDIHKFCYRFFVEYLFSVDMDEIGTFERNPPHDLTVCVAPLYGNESKWLQIVEFVEHMKLEGAAFVYFYVGVISDYDRKILTDYVRTGDVEVIDLHDKYERPYYAWHLITIQDCHLRAKYHSKWVSFLDIDERISGTKNQSLIELLNGQDSNVGEIQIPVLNIVKYDDMPEEFDNVVKLKEDMMFRKWTDSIDPTWNASKAIVKPEKVGIMFIHFAIAKLPGVRTIQVDESQAVVRHFRSTQHRAHFNDWQLVTQADGSLLKITKRPLESEFAEKLTNAIIKRVLNVYDRVPVKCDRIARYLWESRNFPNPCESMSPVF